MITSVFQLMWIKFTFSTSIPSLLMNPLERSRSSIHFATPSALHNVLRSLTALADKLCQGYAQPVMAKALDLKVPTAIRV